MQIALTAEQEALRAELRAYFANLVTPEVTAEMAVGHMGGEACLACVRQMGADGWLGVSWPKTYGGRELGAVEQWIFHNEAQMASVPVPFLTINTVGPTIMEYGTEEQKLRFLPKIRAGELHFSIGYTEPGSGTDLASLKTKAVRDGDEWVINGQKIFTSLAAHADYVWLAARTDPDAPKHRGISIFAVPTDAPGFSYTLIGTMGGGAETTSTFYDDVRVSNDNLVGGLNNGWSLIVNQLNYERVSLAPPAFVEKSYQGVLEWSRNTKTADGSRVIDAEWVQLGLAKVAAHIEVLKLMNWRVASTPGLDPAAASATKVFGTELFLDAHQTLMEIVGHPGALAKGDELAVVKGQMETMYQGMLVLTFGGGTNEIQRDLIAVFGLGMPRALRG